VHRTGLLLSAALAHWLTVVPLGALAVTSQVHVLCAASAAHVRVLEPLFIIIDEFELFGLELMLDAQKSVFDWACFSAQSFLSFPVLTPPLS
jgi:hypothetical protein